MHPLGKGIAKAGLCAGDRVVATSGNLEEVHKAYPDVAPENIAFTQLDVTEEAEAKAAVDEAVKRFGRVVIIKCGIIEIPFRRGELSNQLREFAPVFAITADG